MNDFVPPRKPQGPRAFRDIDYNTPEEPAGKTHGKQSKASGRATPMVNARPIPIIMDSISDQTAIELGGGNRSLGVREALRIVRELRDKEKSE